jgi:hypothetical protein
MVIKAREVKSVKGNIMFLEVSEVTGLRINAKESGKYKL